MRTLLASISSIASVRILFEALGYRGTAAVLGAASVVARWKGFQVAVVESDSPAEAARTLARDLTNLPGRALAVALHPSRQLALAAPRLGGTGTTPVLIVDLLQPSPEAMQALEQCRPTESTGLAHAVQIDNVLNSETAGERFYGSFRHLHRQLVERVGPGPESERHLAALLPLLRLLFLYFVQAKGWLNGNSFFLREQLDTALRQRAHFHRDVLNLLCFQILNRPLAARRSHGFGRIPYLNGGLFEPHRVEQGPAGRVFGNRWWRDAFDDVFERFRFCVRESGQVGAIAPDMLGRVFERLMLTEERHTSGTFYTPEVIVRQIVEASVETALLGSGPLPVEVVRQLIRDRSPDPAWTAPIRRALRKLRVLDPAVGSGGFLLDTLSFLTELNIAVAGQPLEARHRLALRRQVLRHNLFGVDRNPLAVRLAELRLWLAVIADDPTERVEHVEPLPNLDGVVRQGDSLLDPIAAARALGTHPARMPNRQVSVVVKARRALFDTRGKAYHRALATLQEAEADLSFALVEQARRDLNARIQDLDEAAASRDLFGKRIGLTPEQRRARRAFVHQLNALQQESTRAQAGQARFFAFESHVPEVMQAGGFSAVIGNPPWVRSERLAPALRKVLKERFRWWRPEPRVGFNPLPDLSVAFLQRGLELVRPGGAVGLLLPSKIATAAYAARARTGVVRETHLRYVHRVSPSQAELFGAATYPMALIMQNGRPHRDATVTLGFLGDDRISQRTLDRPGPWILVPDRTRLAIDEFVSSAPALATHGTITLGVKTGANAVFLGRAQAISRRRVRVSTGIGTIDLPDRLVRPVVRGRDVGRFTTITNRVILWPFDGRNRALSLSALPFTLATYFRANRAKLVGRSDYRSGPFWIPFRVRGATGARRVVWSDIARRPKAVSLDHADGLTSVPLNTCYVFTAATAEEALVLAAVINSTWAAALVHVTADEARGGYRRINARVVASLPMPRESVLTAALAIISRDAHEKHHVSKDELDDAVADALGLSARARSELRALISHHG